MNEGIEGRELVEIKEIDASEGGQTLRTSISLSALKKEAIKVINIRKNRPKPGLQRQHLTGIRTLSRLCNAVLEFDEMESQELEFNPDSFIGGNFAVNVGSAGAVSLVLQSILLPSLIKETKLSVVGGTDVPFAPPFSFLSEVLFPVLRKMGAKFNAKLFRRGYYPKGNGKISFESKKARLPLKAINLEERGSLNFFKIYSHSMNLPKEVVENQFIRAKQLLESKEKDIEKFLDSSEGPSIGSGIECYAFYDNAVLSGTNLGKKGVNALKVGELSAKNLYSEMNSDGIDSHLADQLIPFMAIAKGTSTISVSKITEHLLTNIKVTEKMLGVKFEVAGELGGQGKISVQGISFK